MERVGKVGSGEFFGCVLDTMNGCFFVALQCG